MTVPYSDLPPDTLSFIHECINSVAQLETLLFLAGKRDRSWNAGEISDELRSDTNLIAGVLTDLLDSGLLGAEASSPQSTLTTRYRYSPQKPATDTVVVSLIQLYKERRHSVMDAIYNKPSPPPVEAEPRGIQAFADAFRWNAKPKKEDN